MIKIINKFNSSISNEEFIDLIIQLDNLDNGTLCESEEDLLADCYNKLYKTCDKQINNNLCNQTFLQNRKETIGDFMIFLKMIY